MGQPKKYGLIKRKPIAPLPSVFGNQEEEDREEAEENSISRANRELIRAREEEAKRILKQSEGVLAENPDLYDYDSYLDTKTSAPSSSSKTAAKIIHPEAKVTSLI